MIIKLSAINSNQQSAVSVKSACAYSQLSVINSFVGTVIVCLFVVLLSHLSLCFGENIDEDKLELPPQSEEGTVTEESETREVERGTIGTESSDTGSPTLPPSQPSETTATTTPNPSQKENIHQQEIVQGTETSIISSPTLPTSDCQLPTPSATRASRIWDKTKQWMTVFAGTSTITGSPSTTGLMLIPTAYRLDKQRKLNIDFVFTYYIGEFWNKTEYKESKMKKIDIFNPINRLSCSGDFKYNLIPEKKWSPAIAFGYHSFIVLQGKASSAGAMGGAVSETSDSFSYTYGILSKGFKNIGLHIGSQSGPIGKLINPISNKLTVTSDRAIIAGLNTTILKHKTCVEIIYPQKKECVMINTFIEKFLPFNFTYIKFNNKLKNDTLNGYSVAGYFGVRIPAFPGEKKEKKK